LLCLYTFPRTTWEQGKETTVRSGSTFIEEKITGSITYEIVLDSKRKEGATEPKFLREVVKFEK